MKKFLYILAILFVCTVLTAGMLVFLSRSSKVQTAAVKLLSERLSYGLDADVHIDYVNFRFFTHLVLDGVYLSDQSKDTLVWIPQMDIQFNPFGLDENKLDFPSVSLFEPYVNIKQDSVSTNMDFLFRAFKKDSVKPLQMDINVDNIEIEGARIRYQHLPSGTNLSISDVGSQLRLPLISKDSIEAELLALQMKMKVNNLDAELAGSFHGNMDTIHADDIELRYRNHRILSGDITVYHPTNLNKMTAQANCRDLYFNSAILENLVADILHAPYTNPVQIARLGNVHYRGQLVYAPEKLYVSGLFSTNPGNISTKATLYPGDAWKDIRCEGRASTKHFQLGHVLGDRDLGSVSANLNFSAEKTPEYPITCSVNGNIQSIGFKKYEYKDICLNVRMEDEIIEGDVSMGDRNITMQVNGLMDISSQAPMANIDIRLDHLKMKELHLSKKVDNQDLQLRANINFSTDGIGNHILDRINGYVIVDSVRFTNMDEELRMRQIKLVVESNDESAFSTNGKPVRNLRVQSDFVTAGINGHFDWSTLPNTFRAMAYRLFPSIISVPQAVPSENELNFYCYLLNSDSLVRALGNTKLHLPECQTVKGSLQESNGYFSLQAHIPAIQSGNSIIKDVALSVDHHTDYANLNVSLQTGKQNYDSTKLKIGDVELIAHARAQNDSVITTMRFGEIASATPKARIDVSTHFSRYLNQPCVCAHIHPSVFNLGDTIWTLNESNIRYQKADTSLAINHFLLQTVSQSIKADGKVSSTMKDSILVGFKDLNLAYLMQIVDISNVLSVEGNATGDMTLYTLFSTPFFEANVTLPQARLNHVLMGDMTAEAKLDRENKRIVISADADIADKRVAHVDGNIIPEKKYWELLIHADSADLGLINFWTDGIVDDIEGRGYGDIHVFSKKKATYVTARTYADHAALTLPYTGVRYYFSDSVIMDTTFISFQDIHITDREGNRGIVNGVIHHDRFKTFTYSIHATCDNLLGIDLPYNANDMYYGRAYATGKADVKGDGEQLKVDVVARTCPRTDFYLTMATASSATDNSKFIEFVDKREQESVVTEKHTAEHTNPGVKMLLSLSIEATPAATVHFDLNDSGDGIVGKGDGNLKFTYDGANDNVKLIGTYVLQSGTFSYSIGNIVRRDFAIAEGSSITWNGDPTEPILNVKAKYRVTASLKDLFGSDVTSLSTNRTSVPVECVVYLSDRLFNPVLNFSIELPQSDEAIASQVQSVINTDEMLMRQVVYLLVFNRFYTPEYLQSSTSTAASSLNATYSLLSSTVTGQINSWLGRLTNIFSLGFNFRTDGEGADAAQEYEAQFQLHPINRLSINGNFGYRYNDISNQPFFGDVDLEYELTQDGKLRAKAYTHTIDKYSLKQASTVQGVGFIFRHDYNWGDAKRKRQAKKAAQTQE